MRSLALLVFSDYGGLYIRVRIVIVIVIGGLKSTGLTKFTYSVYDKDICERHPDYPLTIDAKGCPQFAIRISKLQISLIRGLSFIQTEELQVGMLHKGSLWYRTTGRLHAC